MVPKWHRYLCRYLPLLCIPVVFFGFPAVRPSVLRRTVFVVIGVSSVLVQIAAVSLHHCKELGQFVNSHPQLKILEGGFTDQQVTMFEPETHFLKFRLVNLVTSIDDMVHERIPPWPTEPPDPLATEIPPEDTVLRYLAFWPFHMTYYLPMVMPSLALPLWGSTLIFLGGVLIGLWLLYLGWCACPLQATETKEG